MIQRSIPLVLHAAALSQALPLLAALRYGRLLPTPRRWVVAWCVVSLLSDSIQFLIRRSHQNNLLVWYIAVPVSNAIMLWTLSLWQRDSIARLAFRLAIPLYLLALLVLVPTLGSVDVFAQFTWPFQGLVLLAASLYTLIRRTADETAPITSRDWFWITLGVSIYFSIKVALPPFVQVTVRTNPDLAAVAYVVSAWIDILALLLIARGMLCPLPPMHSDGSSS